MMADFRTIAIRLDSNIRAILNQYSLKKYAV